MQNGETCEFKTENNRFLELKKNTPCNNINSKYFMYSV